MKAYILHHEVDDRGYHWYLCRTETKNGTRFFTDVRKPTNPITIDNDGYAHCVYDTKKRILARQ